MIFECFYPRVRQTDSSVTAKLGDHDAHLILDDAGVGKLRTGYLKKISDVKVVLAQDLYPGWYMDLNHIRPDSIIHRS